jgi:hypothetical protein
MLEVRVASMWVKVLVGGIVAAGVGNAIGEIVPIAAPSDNSELTEDEAMMQNLSVPKEIALVPEREREAVAVQEPAELAGAAIRQIEAMNSLSGGPSGVENATKAILNLNGHLCADIVDVKPRARVGEFEVTCIEYRSGAGSARYVLNGETGEASEL